MARRFQFSLGRVLACIAILSFAVAACANILAAAAESGHGIPFLMACIATCMMAGAGIGFLVSNRAVLTFLGAAAAFASLSVLGFFLVTL
ncbi:MAG TPA: hypothetical protein VHC22_28475 [Pirellulales bacterium]|nr:hypothetical protein [Pirellulales bacterium]